MDIAARSGLTMGKVTEISRLDRWDSLPVGVAMAFAEGCGVDFTRLRRHQYFARRRKLRHLDRYPQFYRRLLADVQRRPEHD